MDKKAIDNDIIEYLEEDEKNRENVDRIKAYLDSRKIRYEEGTLDAN